VVRSRRASPPEPSRRARPHLTTARNVAVTATTSETIEAHRGVGLDRTDGGVGVSTHGMVRGQAPTSNRAKRATSSFSPTIAWTSLIFCATVWSGSITKGWLSRTQSS
jgi:hypothetical protein